MITVHHLGVSQSERVVWLCEELAIPYQLRRYDRDPTTHLAPADYKALHPMGIAPVITDGALVLAESGAILEYVIAKYGNGRLDERETERVRVFRAPVTGRTRLPLRPSRIYPRR